MNFLPKDKNEKEQSLPKDGSQDIPEEFSKNYPSELEAKKINKPLIVYLLDIDKEKKTRPTLVVKPIKTKYGAKWVNRGGKNGERYFINYKMIMNFGKHYAYLCQYGNGVGALSFYEYPEFVDSNQLELMVNQHAVEVFKKHKGISQKLVIIIAIVAAIGIIGTVVTSQIALAQMNSANTWKTSYDRVNSALADMKCKYEQVCPPPPVAQTGTVTNKVK